MHPLGTYLTTPTRTLHYPLKFFEGVEFEKFEPLLPKIMPTNFHRFWLIADPYNPLQSLKFLQKFGF